jgi:hypothetical protein
MTGTRSAAVASHSPEAAKLCLRFYLATLCITVGYIAFTGELNGDFYGVPLAIGIGELTFVTLISIAPYIVGYLMYRRFVRTAPPPTVRVSNSLLGVSFFAVTIWFIILAVKYDVGVLGREIYDAPSLIKPIIQVTNRINPFYLGAFFIVGYRGSKTTIAIGILLMITLGVLRAGLGVFMYVLLALAIRNHDSLRDMLRRHFVKLLIAVVLFPIAVSQLYALRSQLREAENVSAELSALEVVTARLAGRLSSLSNTVFIFQESTQFRSDVRALSPWYYQRQTLAPLFGVGVIPEDIPERLLINVNGGSLFDVSFMTGVSGNLAMAWFLHPLIAVMNALTMVAMVWLSLFFANKLDLPYRNEVCFMLLLYPLTSGVGNEFSFIVVSMIALIILFSLLKVLRPRRTPALT